MYPFSNFSQDMINHFLLQWSGSAWKVIAASGAGVVA